LTELSNEIDFSKILIADSTLFLAEEVRKRLASNYFISKENVFVAKSGAEIVQLLTREKIGNALLSHMLLDYLGDEKLLRFFKELDSENRKLVFWLNSEKDWKFASVIVRAGLEEKYPIYAKTGIDNFDRMIWLEFPNIFTLDPSCGI
jgi:hypothetical protein